MKIVQSLWSYPVEQAGDCPGNRFKGGWPHERDHWMSWALSCLTLKQFYPKVELITDHIGKKMLIDQLQLPYTKVSTDLNELNGYPSKAWALGKLKAYGLQNEPFLHVDGDVYLWQKLENAIENQNLVVQSRTDFTQHLQVEELALAIQNELTEVPTAIKNHWKHQSPLFAINAGIIGGNDLAFFKEYSKQAFAFIDANVDRFDVLNGHLLNMIFEEHLFFCLAAYQQKDIAFYFGAINQPFKEVSRFHLLPFYANYIHVIGEAKQNAYTSEQVALHLREKFPEYYQRILELFPEPENNQDIKVFSVWPWTNTNEKSPYRKVRLHHAYQWMQNKEPKQLWEASMILSSTAMIQETKNDSVDTEFLLNFTCPLEGYTKNLKLEGWDLLLTYFCDSTSCVELFNKMMEDEQIRISYLEQEHILKDTIMDVVFSFFYYYEALAIVSDVPKGNEK